MSTSINYPKQAKMDVKFQLIWECIFKIYEKIHLIFKVLDGENRFISNYRKFQIYMKTFYV